LLGPTGGEKKGKRGTRHGGVWKKKKKKKAHGSRHKNNYFDKNGERGEMGRNSNKKKNGNPKLTRLEGGCEGSVPLGMIRNLGGGRETGGTTKGWVRPGKNRRVSSFRDTDERKNDNSAGAQRKEGNQVVRLGDMGRGNKRAVRVRADRVLLKRERCINNGRGPHTPLRQLNSKERSGRGRKTEGCG